MKITHPKGWLYKKETQPAIAGQLISASTAWHPDSRGWQISNLQGESY